MLKSEEDVFLLVPDNDFFKFDDVWVWVLHLAKLAKDRYFT